MHFLSAYVKPSSVVRDSRGKWQHRDIVVRSAVPVGFIVFSGKLRFSWFNLNLTSLLKLQIIEYEKKQTLGQNDTGFSCDGTANTFRVMFKEPVEILPNVCYTACATLKVRVFPMFPKASWRGPGSPLAWYREPVLGRSWGHWWCRLVGRGKLGSWERSEHSLARLCSERHASSWEVALCVSRSLKVRQKTK